MKKGIVFLILICLTLATKAQKNYFIYLQTDNKQAFSVKMNGKDLSSSASGYIVISKLPKGEHSFTISFPKNEWPKQSFNILLNNNDEGYMLKNFSEKGWGLFNLQSMDIVMNGDPFKKAKVPTENTEVEIVKTNIPEVKIPEVKVEAVKVEQVNTVEKVEEMPVAKVATKNADRTPVLQVNPEPEIVKTKTQVTEKPTEVIKEIPAPKVEEKIVEVVKEIPAVKVEEKIIEAVKEKPTPIVEEKVVETIKEKPVVKVEEKKIIPEPTETEVAEKNTSKNKDVISKISSYDDIDGITITYKVVTPSGVDIVPIFVEKNMQLTNETTTPKSEEKFIEHIELKNPNETKVEKIEEPKTAKVATNNANRAPVELSKVEKVEKVEVVEKPLKTEKVNQGEIIDYTEKIKKVEPVVEKKEEPIKIEKLAVEKIVEKVEEPIKVAAPKVEKVAEKMEEPIKVVAPIITEKPVDYGANNPLKITEADKSSRTSRNITAINSDCADRKATEEDFFKTRKKMIADDYNEDAMVDAALKQFKLKCFSVEQIKNLALVFLTDEGKYKLVDAAYPYTYESNLYASLEPLFKEVYFIKRFKVMLER